MTTDSPLPQPSWQPPAARPPLSQRNKAGVALAGSLGFLLLSFGFGLFAVPLAVLAFSAFFRLIIRVMGRVEDARDPDLERFADFVRQLDLDAWVIPLVLVSLLGLAIMAASLYLSARILAAHAVSRPWAVTWAGAGVAIVGSWVVSGVLGFVTQIFSFGADAGDEEYWGFAIVAGIASTLVNLAAAAVVGWLSWWLVAHLLRPATPAAASA